MFYEMVTDRKAFDREDVESLQQSIIESTPVPPMHVNPKLHPLLSDLIVKALSKDPEQRYQSGRELLDDLEKCKESKPHGGEEVRPGGQESDCCHSGEDASSGKNHRAACDATAGGQTSQRGGSEPAGGGATCGRAPGAEEIYCGASTDARAGGCATSEGSGGGGGLGRGGGSSSPAMPQLDPSSQFITSCVKATIDTASEQQATMSSAVVEEPEVEAPEAPAPRIAVDPSCPKAARVVAAVRAFRK